MAMGDGKCRLYSQYLWVCVYVCVCGGCTDDDDDDARDRRRRGRNDGDHDEGQDYRRYTLSLHTHLYHILKSLFVHIHSS